MTSPEGDRSAAERERRLDALLDGARARERTQPLPDSERFLARVHSRLAAEAASPRPRSGRSALRWSLGSSAAALVVLGVTWAILEPWGSGAPRGVNTVAEEEISSIIELLDEAGGLDSEILGDLDPETFDLMESWETLPSSEDLELLENS